eukprot:PhF_6_TR40370/c0_g1_i1/m.60093
MPLGGSANATVFEEDRFAPITQIRGQGLPHHNIGSLNPGNTFLVEYNVRHQKSRIAPNAFHQFTLNSKQVLLLVARDPTPEEPTYYWTQHPSCEERGIPKVRERQTLTSDARKALLGRLLQQVGPQPNMMRQQEMHLDAFIGGVRRLCQDLKSREIQKLCESDKAVCTRIAASFKEYIALGGTIDKVANVLNQSKQGAQTILETTRPAGTTQDDPLCRTNINRFIVYDDNETLAIKVFQCADETFQHNHSTSVVSVALKGSYLHTTFGLEDDAAKSLQLFVRQTDPSTGITSLVKGPFMKHKKLSQRSQYQFAEGSSYFLDKNSFHTVKGNVDIVTNDYNGLASRSMISLFFKDRYKSMGPEFVDVHDAIVEEIPVTDQELLNRIKGALHRRLRQSTSESSFEFDAVALLGQTLQNVMSTVPTSDAGYEDWVGAQAVRNKEQYYRVHTALCTTLASHGLNTPDVQFFFRTTENDLELDVVVLASKVQQDNLSRDPSLQRWIPVVTRCI